MQKLNRPLRIGWLSAALDGCRLYRVVTPMNALSKRFGVDWQDFLFLPRQVGVSQYELALNLISNFDIFIVQRIYVLDYVEVIRKACNFLGVPMVFETDDDYLSLIPSNPAYFSLADQGLFTRYHELLQAGKSEEAQALIPELKESRLQGLENYKKILAMADWVTCSTEELARSIRVYNKNVKVFENNIERVWPWRDDNFENDFYTYDSAGNQRIGAKHRFHIYTVPNYQKVQAGNTTSIKRNTRFGYTCTASHFGEDFGSINAGLNKFLDKYQDETWMLYIGDTDRRFFNQQTARTRAACMPTVTYEGYIQNIRNIDVGLCPLFPTEFNMSKSDIKVVEYGSWGIPAIIPHYVTYLRHWTPEVNCLSYRNQEEFFKCCERMHTDRKLREKLGAEAYRYVSENRIEEDNCQPRYEFYKSLVEEFPRIKKFKGELQVASLS